MFSWLGVKLAEIRQLSSALCCEQEGGRGSGEELPTAGFNARVREVERVWRLRPVSRVTHRERTTGWRRRDIWLSNMRTSGGGKRVERWRMRG